MRPPSVDALARSLAHTGLPHPLLVDIARGAIASGDPDQAAQMAEQLRRTLLQPVINATGVLLHTNLGRAPIAHSQDARFSNLELDLTTGQRGSRSSHVAMLAAKASGAEAALIANNGAAAVLLALTALAKGR
ncbi:MAG: L-seryl-tRNA(Sec) selenium transferase, partial [Acidimicrobiales bacterium]